MEHFNIAFCQWDFYCLVDSPVLLDSYYSINEAKLIYTNSGTLTIVHGRIKATTEVH